MPSGLKFVLNKGPLIGAVKISLLRDNCEWERPTLDGNVCVKEYISETTHILKYWMSKILSENKCGIQLSCNNVS